MTDTAGDGFRPRLGDLVEYNISASVADPYQWHLGNVRSVNADGTYDVSDEAVFKIPVAALRAPVGKNVQQVVAGDTVMCFLSSSASGQATDMWFPGRVRSTVLDNGEDGTGELTACNVNLVHRGVRPAQLRPANLWAVSARSVVAIYPVAMLCVLAIAMIVVTDNLKSRDETGESPRPAFAVITPTGCDPAVGRKLYGNDTSLWWGAGGWQFFQRVGVCPVAGIVQVSSYNPSTTALTAINYQGCLDFQNADLWQGMDALNKAAGVATNLAGAASAQLGLFQTLNGVGTACVWVAFFASGGLTVVGTFDSRARRAAIVAAWLVPTGVAFALFLVSLRLVLGSELLKGASYTNNIFRSCTSVTVAMATATARAASAYTTHLTLVCFLGVLLFLVLVSSYSLVVTVKPAAAPFPVGYDSPMSLPANKGDDAMERREPEGVELLEKDSVGPRSLV